MSARLLERTSATAHHARRLPRAAEPFGLAPLSGDTPSVGVVGDTLGGGLSLRLHPVPSVYGGTAEFPVEGAEPALRYLAEHGDQLPDELSVSLVISKESLVVRAVYAGADGRGALQPLLDAAGTPSANDFREMRYSEVSAIGGTPPITFAMYDELSPATIAAIIGSDVTVEVEHWGGAIARPEHGDPGPVSHRDARFVVKIAAPAAAAASITETATGGSFLNFLHLPARTHTAFTPENLRRLRVVKTMYDPDNLFHRGHNIAPLPSRITRRG